MFVYIATINIKYIFSIVPFLDILLIGLLVHVKSIVFTSPRECFERPGLVPRWTYLPIFKIIKLFLRINDVLSSIRCSSVDSHQVTELARYKDLFERTGYLKDI